MVLVPYWKWTVVVSPLGLTVPLSIAEELVMLLAPSVVAVGVGVGLDSPQYLPPVFNTLPDPKPPQTIISLPVQTAVWLFRARGALVVLVGVHVSVLGLYLPPVFNQ